MIRLLLSGIRFYWRTHLGVMLGTALATAILTGSLLVGDSVDGSLRLFALQRLGNIHYAMATPGRFVSAGLAARMAPDMAAVLQLRGMALAEDRQANQVQVFGCDSNFWAFAGIELPLGATDVALNEKLAQALGVGVGDEVALRVEKPGLLPREAPLSAQQDDQTARGLFTVKRILSDGELGRFGLSPSQSVPYNAFVDLAALGSRVALEGKANLLLAGQGDPVAALRGTWQPEDFGLRFREEGGIVQLESDAVYLGAEAVRAALAVPGAHGTLTYLVNSLSSGGRATPYSFAIARDGWGLADDEIAINRWLADELDVGIGDPVEMEYYELLPANRFEIRKQKFTVRRIVEMQKMQLERALSPQFPGLTDVERCADWDVGFPMEQERLEDEANEAYWNAYGPTPKAIISLAAGQVLWSNRFGNVTSVRGEGGAGGGETFRAQFDPSAAGYVFQPVREQALAAVDEAMDFGQLFVGMSFFLIVAALMLTGLLFVFGVQQRAEEMGVLLATGWRPGRIRRLLLAEGGVVALAGSVAGAWLGTGYTQLLILGISTYWQGAVARSAIRFFADPKTVATGAVAGFSCALAAMLLASRRQTRHSARELLTADFSQELNPDATDSRSRMPRLPWLFLALALGVVAYALLADVQSATMPFFSAGALLLVAGVLFFKRLLARMGQLAFLPSVAALAVRNVSRRSGRSLAVVALMACGCFLVFAVSSMQEDVAAHADEPSSGTGGFAWFGESTLPIRDDLGGVRLRVRDGDDASCLNLNRARSPRLLGVDPAAMSQRQAFVRGGDFWPLLDLELPDGMVPGLVGDSDTAMWGLKAKTGVEHGDVLEYLDEAGRPFKIKLVGAMPMRLSVFQGTVLVSEADFIERFPGEEGYRMFLLDDPVERWRHERAGLDAVPSAERLMEFYAVESTYLAMFLVLGVMGLAVGSMGMGVVVLRNVQDRRAETALLRAVGYRNATLRGMLLVEHGALLLGGLGIGSLAAAVAMVPAFFLTRSAVPFGSLAVLLLAVAAVGAACMALAVGAALRGDALRGLRNE